MNPTHSNPTPTLRDRVAHAPYNFVPLPEQIVRISYEIPPHDNYSGNTGYLDCTLTTLTPTYTRTALDPDFFARWGDDIRRMMRDDQAREIYSQFFHIDDAERPIIPGSSLRGMVRAMIEVVGYGKMQWVSEKDLIFRAVGDPSSLGQFYRHFFSGPNKASPPNMHFDYPSPQVKGGYLKVTSNGYAIQPAREPYKGESFIRVEDKDAKKVIGGIRQHAVYDIYVEPIARSKSNRGYRGKGILELDVAVTPRINDKAASGLVQAKLVVSGHMGGNHPKHWHCAIYEPDTSMSLIPIPERLWMLYTKDQDVSGRTRRIENDGDPLFYLVTPSDELIFFGPTIMFRIPYQSSPRSFVPSHLKGMYMFSWDEVPGSDEGRLKEVLIKGCDIDWAENAKIEKSDDGKTIKASLNEKSIALKLNDEKTRVILKIDNVRIIKFIAKMEQGNLNIYKEINYVDLAEAIFGYLEKGGTAKGRAGRVYFTDAICELGQKDIYLPQGIITPQILGSPKPTTFQHYLVQDKGEGKGHDPDQKDKLAHYGTPTPDETVIRGHKLYWHKQDGLRVEDFSENKVINWKSDTQHAQIKPVSEGIRFSFRVYFESLTNVELGALLWAMDLPKGYHHKIGMGKPLGLGSVAISLKLIITNRSQRYSKLFNDNYWNTGEDADLYLAKYKEEFEDYVLRHMDQNERDSAQALSQLPRIQMLLKMLKWPGPNPDLTNFMTIDPNKYKDRPVLPDPLNMESHKGVIIPLPKEKVSGSKNINNPSTKESIGLTWLENTAKDLRVSLDELLKRRPKDLPRRWTAIQESELKNKVLNEIAAQLKAKGVWDNPPTRKLEDMVEFFKSQLNGEDTR
jgi:hypothetical protein